ncbi:MAG: hypothetical protein RL172_825 [Bacteroidota bacterium]|jgi:hypothetical protein
MKKIKNIAVALLAIVLFASNSFAGTPAKNINAIVDEPTAEQLVVNFLGEEGNYLVFQVVIKPGSNKSVSLAVTDKAEGELYNSVFSTTKTQTFKIEKRDNQELEFNLVSGKKSVSKSFTIIPVITLSKL